MSEQDYRTKYKTLKEKAKLDKQLMQQQIELALRQLDEQRFRQQQLKSVNQNMMSVMEEWGNPDQKYLVLEQKVDTYQQQLLECQNRLKEKEQLLIEAQDSLKQKDQQIQEQKDRSRQVEDRFKQVEDRFKQAEYQMQERTQRLEQQVAKYQDQIRQLKKYEDGGLKYQKELQELEQLVQQKDRSQSVFREDMQRQIRKYKDRETQYETEAAILRQNIQQIIYQLQEKDTHIASLTIRQQNKENLDFNQKQYFHRNREIKNPNNRMFINDSYLEKEKDSDNDRRLMNASCVEREKTKMYLNASCIEQDKSRNRGQGSFRQKKKLYIDI